MVGISGAAFAVSIVRRNIAGADVLEYTKKEQKRAAKVAKQASKAGKKTEKQKAKEDKKRRRKS